MCDWRTLLTNWRYTPWHIGGRAREVASKTSVEFHQINPQTGKSEGLIPSLFLLVISYERNIKVKRGGGDERNVQRKRHTR